MAERVFLPWVHAEEPVYAWLDTGWPAVVEPVSPKVVFGESAAADLADAEIVFDLSPDHGKKLADSVPNTLSILVVSDRLRSLLAATGEEIDFHPVRIRNLKGRMVKDPYFLANPLGAVDCMDREQSDFEESALEPGQVNYFRRLVLDPERIPADRKLFRLASQKDLVLVRKDLAYEIFRVQKCEGMIFQAIETFGEEFR